MAVFSHLYAPFYVLTLTCVPQTDVPIQCRCQLVTFIFIYIFSYYYWLHFRGCILHVYLSYIYIIKVCILEVNILLFVHFKCY